MINETMTPRPAPPMLHVAIDTPNGRWLQGDFDTSEEAWDWISDRFLVLREKYGQHEWFKIRIEEFQL